MKGAGRSEDELAFLRDGGAFRNVQLVEMPNGDFATTMARQFYFDHAHLLLLRALARSTDARIAEIAAKAAKEVAYHAERSADWVIRLGDGTEESHARMQTALDALWPYTGEMFTADAVDDALIDAGIAADARTLREPWLAAVRRGARRGDARAAGRRMDAGRAAAAAASRACTPSISATCWPRCSTCSARTRARSGDGHRGASSAIAAAASRRGHACARRGVGRAADGARSRGSGDLDRRTGHRARRRVESTAACAIEVTPTYSGCPATEMIATMIRERLAAIGVRDVDLVQRLSPPWTTDWIAPEGEGESSRRSASRRRMCCAAAIDVTGISPLRRAGIVVPCPRCGSAQTTLLSQFGSTACKAQYRCDGVPRAVRLFQAALMQPTMSKFHRCRSPASSARRATPSPSRSPCPKRCATSSATRRAST